MSLASFAMTCQHYALVNKQMCVHVSVISFCDILYNGSIGEKRRTRQKFPMARPKCLMGDFINLYGIYKTHQTNV